MTDGNSVAGTDNLQCPSGKALLKKMLYFWGREEMVRVFSAEILAQVKRREILLQV